MSTSQSKDRPQVDQVDWVERVLKVKMGARTTAPSKQQVAAWQSACAEFQSAVETVSAQIEKLRQAVAQYGREADDEEMLDLSQRADLGINGFTKNTFVRLRAALSEAAGDDAARLQQTVPTVMSNAALVAAALQGNEQVDAACDNPFGVPVDIIGKLVPSLDRLRSVGSGLVSA